MMAEEKSNDDEGIKSLNNILRFQRHHHLKPISTDK